ncbi:MAG: hypothetical protein ORO03_00640, partial [Alphaproteobacteria bacterium]|nr:hypothetical protein [Alphaproteobacteria bacterium]
LNSGGGLVSLSGGVTATAGSIDLASGGGGVILGGALTSDSAAASTIAITTSGGGLSLAAAVTTTNGVVTLDLGTGAYSQNETAGHSFTTTNRNLSLTAGSIVAKNSATVFALGSGSFTLTSTTPQSSLVSTTIVSADTRYDGGFVNAGNESRITSSAVVYYFTTKSGLEFTTLNTTITGADANGVLLNISALSQAGFSLGKKVEIPAGQSTGLSGGTGTTGAITWSSGSAAPTETPFSLQTGRVVHFRDVTNSAYNSLTLANSGIVFDGSNSFTAGLTLTTTGAITQSSGATLTVSGDNLVMTAGAGGITLNQLGNDLGTLGVIGSGGAVRITNSAGNLTLAGNLSVTTAVVVGTAITISTVDRALTLTTDIVTSGGAVELNLGTGTYVNGTRKLTTGGKNLSLTAGDIGNKDSTAIFDLGVGVLTVGQTGVKLSSRNTNTARTDFNSDYVNSGNFSVYSHASVVYYVTSDTGAALAADQTAVGDASTSLWLSPSALNAANLGTYTAVPANQVTQVGFSTSTGTIGWTKDNNTPPTTLRFTAGRPLHFYKLTNFALTVTTLPVVFSDLHFDGVNSFTGNLSLSNNSGQVIQSLLNGAGGITLTGGGSLTLAAGGAISLDAANNSFGALSVTTTSGAITIRNTGALTVTALRSNNGAISLTTIGSGSDLRLSSDLASTSGKLTLNLGGNYVPNGFQWNLGGNELSLTATGWGGGAETTVAFTNVGVFTALGGMVPRLAGGNPYTERRDDPKVAWGRNGGLDYFTTLSYGSEAYVRAEAELSQINPQATLHPWSDLTAGTHRDYFAKIEKVGSSVQWTASRTETVVNGGLSVAKVGFYNIRQSGAEIQNLSGVTEISFAGVNQLTAGLNFSTNSSLTKLSFADNASLKGGVLTLNSALMGGG